MKSQNLKIYAESLLSSRNSQNYVPTAEIEAFSLRIRALEKTPEEFASLLLLHGAGLGLVGTYSDWFEAVSEEEDLLEVIQKLDLLSLGKEFAIGAASPPSGKTKAKSAPGKKVRVKIGTWPATEKLQTQFEFALSRLTSESKASLIGKVVILGLVATSRGSKNVLSTEYAILERFDIGREPYLENLLETTNRLWISYIERQALLGVKFILTAHLRQFELSHSGVEFLNDEEAIWLLSKLSEGERIFILEAQNIFSPFFERSKKPKTHSANFPGGTEAMDALRHRIYGDDIN